MKLKADWPIDRVTSRYYFLLVFRQLLNKFDWYKTTGGWLKTKFLCIWKFGGGGEAAGYINFAQLIICYPSPRLAFPYLSVNKTKKGLRFCLMYFLRTPDFVFKNWVFDVWKQQAHNLNVYCKHLYFRMWLRVHSLPLLPRQQDQCPWAGQPRLWLPVYTAWLLP